MRRKLGAHLTWNRALVLVIGLLFALAWAVPSIGASAGKVARTALARSNQAVHDSNVAVATSNTAKSTATNANNTSNEANATANTANANANSAKATANTALSAANAAAQVFANATKTISPGNIGSDSCVPFLFSQAGVAATDEVIVTPPSNLDLGIIVQAGTGAGSVTLTLCNITNSGIDPGSDSYEYSVIR